MIHFTKINDDELSNYSGEVFIKTLVNEKNNISFIK